MRGYFGINLPISACLHFTNEEDLCHAKEELEAATSIGIEIAYFDAKNEKIDSYNLMNAVGNQLNLENRPYDEGHWVRFLDDMITKSYNSSGVVILLDQVGFSLSKLDNELFDFIESMMIQLHHWMEQKKPFHICLQLNGCVSEVIEIKGEV